MRGLQAVVGLAAIVASVLLFRIVFHAYSHHGQTDLLHGLVAVTALAAGALFLSRALVRRSA